MAHWYMLRPTTRTVTWRQSLNHREKLAISTEIKLKTISTGSVIVIEDLVQSTGEQEKGIYRFIRNY